MQHDKPVSETITESEHESAAPKCDQTDTFIECSKKGLMVTLVKCDTTSSKTSKSGKANTNSSTSKQDVGLKESCEKPVRKSSGREKKVKAKSASKRVESEKSKRKKSKQKPLSPNPSKEITDMESNWTPGRVPDDREQSEFLTPNEYNEKQGLSKNDDLAGESEEQEQTVGENVTVESSSNISGIEKLSFASKSEVENNTTLESSSNISGIEKLSSSSKSGKKKKKKKKKSKSKSKEKDPELKSSSEQGKDNGKHEGKVEKMKRTRKKTSKVIAPLTIAPKRDISAVEALIKPKITQNTKVKTLPKKSKPAPVLYAAPTPSPASTLSSSGATPSHVRMLDFTMQQTPPTFPGQSPPVSSLGAQVTLGWKSPHTPNSQYGNPGSVQSQYGNPGSVQSQYGNPGSVQSHDGNPGSVPSQGGCTPNHVFSPQVNTPGSVHNQPCSTPNHGEPFSPVYQTSAPTSTIHSSPGPTVIHPSLVDHVFSQMGASTTTVMDNSNIQVDSSITQEVVSTSSYNMPVNVSQDSILPAIPEESSDVSRFAASISNVDSANMLRALAEQVGIPTEDSLMGTPMKDKTAFNIESIPELPHFGQPSMQNVSSTNGSITQEHQAAVTLLEMANTPTKKQTREPGSNNLVSTTGVTVTSGETPNMKLVSHHFPDGFQNEDSSSSSVPSEILMPPPATTPRRLYKTPKKCSTGLSTGFTPNKNVPLSPSGFTPIKNAPLSPSVLLGYTTPTKQEMYPDISVSPMRSPGLSRLIEASQQSELSFQKSIQDNAVNNSLDHSVNDVQSESQTSSTMSESENLSSQKVETKKEASKPLSKTTDPSKVKKSRTKASKSDISESDETLKVHRSRQSDKSKSKRKKSDKKEAKEKIKQLNEELLKTPKQVVPSLSDRSLGEMSPLVVGMSPPVATDSSPVMSSDIALLMSRVTAAASENCPETQEMQPSLPTSQRVPLSQTETQSNKEAKRGKKRHRHREDKEDSTPEKKKRKVSC